MTNDLCIDIYADGANLADILELNDNPLINGFTCNPSLMRKAGVTDYEKFAKEVLYYVKDKPVSFEVIADDMTEIHRQAKIISSWGNNVYVKIPIMNTQGKSTVPLCIYLSSEGIKINVTAIMTYSQMMQCTTSIKAQSSIFSYFAGRSADCGVDPYLEFYNKRAGKYQNQKWLWASTREILNVTHAKICQFDVITLSKDLIAKLPVLGTDLNKMCKDTVTQFYNDAKESGYTL